MPNDTDTPKKKNPLEKIDQEILRLKQRRKKIEARLTLAERKERTRRIIQYGLISGAILNCGYNIDPKEFEQLLLAKIKDTPKS